MIVLLSTTVRLDGRVSQLAGMWQGTSGAYSPHGPGYLADYYLLAWIFRSWSIAAINEPSFPE